MLHSTNLTGIENTCFDKIPFVTASQPVSLLQKWTVVIFCPSFFLRRERFARRIDSDKNINDVTHFAIYFNDRNSAACYPMLELPFAEPLPVYPFDFIFT